MAKYIVAIPDRFSTAEKDLANGKASSSDGKSGSPFIRRPTRGIQIKEDTFATLRVVAGAEGKPIRLVDAGSRRKVDDEFIEVGGKRTTDIYSNFLLQSIQEDRQEKQQIMETFGEPYLFLYGERPRIMAFSGILVNTFDFNWESEWWHNYENYLRGTKCVENDARVYLSFDNTLVSGYILSSSATKSATERNYVQFQFQLFVTGYTNFVLPGDPHAYPGARTLGYVSATGEGTIPETTARIFRPSLLSTGSTPTDQRSIGPGGSTASPSLMDKLRNTLLSVKKAWDLTSNAVNTTIAGVSGLLNQDNVRVPVGFAGSLAFDDSEDVHLYDVKFGGVVKYTTFDRNDDEYVGVSDHYGSSTGLASETYRKILNGFGNQKDDLTYGNEMVKAATDEWKKAGFSVSKESLDPVASFLISKGLGISGAVVAGTLNAASASSSVAQSAIARGASLASAAAMAKSPTLARIAGAPPGSGSSPSE